MLTPGVPVRCLVDFPRIKSADSLAPRSAQQLVTVSVNAINSAQLISERVLKVISGVSTIKVSGALLTYREGSADIPRREC
jgi:hypothetical protein